MRTSFKHLRRGFTLIELSIAVLIGMATGAMVLALFNQQLAFLKMYKAQNFLTDEAPIINMYVSRLIGRAERFSLHDSEDEASSAAVDATLEDSPALLLDFRQPDGTVRSAIIAHENNELSYHDVQSGDQWVISKAPSDVIFSMNGGVLRMTIIGPKRERITYSGTMQQ
jgi:Prokaryotic N-terminal methylation motif